MDEIAILVRKIVLQRHALELVKPEERGKVSKILQRLCMELKKALENDGRDAEAI
jgi:hypothetical protein